VPGFVLDDVVRVAGSGPIARLAETAVEMEQYLMDGRLDEVQVPVDLVWGASDRLFPLSYARALEQGLPEARLTLIEQCGHVPHQECPERMLGTLRRVLEQAPPAAEPDEEDQDDVAR